MRATTTPDSTSETSAEVREALRQGELLRLRTFGGAIIVPSIGGLVLNVVVPSGDPVLADLTDLALAALAIGGALVWHCARDGGPSTLNINRVFGGVCTAASLIICAYLGVLSPAGTVIAVGISFFSLAERARSLASQFAIVVVLYVIYGLLVAFGLVADHGLMTMGDMPLASRVGMVLLTACLFGIASLQARTSRRATEIALRQVERVTLEVRRRESQLAEYRSHLDVAVRARGDRGRYAGTWAGRFVLDEIVGRGSMGEVYAATDPRTGERAAVKLLRIDAAAQPMLVERFLREAKIAAKLRSSFLVEMRDSGRLTDGSPFITMELLEGCDLGTRLRRDEKLTIPEVVELAHDMAAALDVAHGAGVVHRDLKPQNVFQVRGTNGRPAGWKVLDFGVCALRESAGTLTDRDEMIGTPHYIPPEQVLGLRGDHRADVFAMGVLLYRVLTGQLPFGGDLAAVLYAVVYESPPRPRAIAPHLNTDVERILALALAKTPVDRFGSAMALADALRRAVAGELPAALRRRADALIARAPWGKPVTRGAA